MPGLSGTIEIVPNAELSAAAITVFATVVAVNIPKLFTVDCAEFASSKPAAFPVLVIITVPAPPAPSLSVNDTVESAGLCVTETVKYAVSAALFDVAAPKLADTTVDAAEPTATLAVAAATEVASTALAAALAGAIAVNVPIASEATATADTFFNEIVFTIFLSFSQIKDVLLSGW